LGEGIAKCRTLTSLKLDLRDNSINENGAKYLREGIANSLTSLNLAFRRNSIDDNGAKYLGELITNCVTLTSLDLDLGKN